MEFHQFRQQLNAGNRRPSYLLNGYRTTEVEKVLELLQRTLETETGEVDRESWTAPEGVASTLVSARSRSM